MRSRTTSAAVAALLLAACGGGGSGVVTVTDSWASPTPPNAPTAAIYVQIENGTDSGDRLVNVSVDRCDAVELHTTNIDENRIMRMRLAAPEALLIPAGKTLEMEPGGLHVMCIGLDITKRVSRAAQMAPRSGGRGTHNPAAGITDGLATQRRTAFRRDAQMHETPGGFA